MFSVLTLSGIHTGKSSAALLWFNYLRPDSLVFRFTHIHFLCILWEISLKRLFFNKARIFFFEEIFVWLIFLLWFFFEKKYELFKIRRMRKLKINYSLLNQLLLKLLPDWSVLITNRRVLPRIFHRHVAELTDLRKCLFFYF